MLLTLSTNRHDACDLGHLLHKHPQRVQTIALPWGTAHVFYPDRTDERCTVALHVDVDPVALVRGRGTTLQDYVNDRPLVASSFLAVALSRCFGTAIAGRCARRPELVDEAFPLIVELPAVAPGRASLARRLFAPLGYEVHVTTHLLDDAFPTWGPSRVVGLRLSHTLPVRDVLRQLYVLLPVLDDEKHYFVERAEADKLVRLGGDWLATHPDRELIVHRYLKRRRELVRHALDAMSSDADAGSDDAEQWIESAAEPARRLNDLRYDAVAWALRAAGAKRVLDLGCGDGRMLCRLADTGAFDELCGVEVSQRALEVATRRLARREARDDVPPTRVALRRGGLTCVDPFLRGWDAACLVEVIEHIDEPRLPALVDAVFGDARPATVIATTPNVEYNVVFPDMEPGEMRHHDHRFEWDRSAFRAWAEAVARDHHYTVAFEGIGPEHPDCGSATQMAVFSRSTTHTTTSR